jgi:hypothetical protein
MEACGMRRAVIVIVCLCIVIASLFMVSIFYFLPEQAPEQVAEVSEQAPEQVAESDRELIPFMSVEEISIKREGKNDLRAILTYPAMEVETALIVIIGDWYLFGGSTHEYSGWAEFFADKGYISMLIEPENFSDPFLPLAETDVWSEDLGDAIEWAEVNLSVNGVGVFAHGLGATAAMRYGSGSNTLDAMVALSGGSPGYVEELSVPLQIFTGDFDLLSYAAWLFDAPLYYSAHNPKEIITISAGTHWGMSDFIDAFMPEPYWEKDVIAHYSLAWFDYFLKDNKSAYKAITEPYGGLSPVMPSLYDLGSGEQQIAGGKLFFKDALNNSQRAFRSAPEALKPLTRNVLDVCTSADYILAVLPGFLGYATDTILAWVRAIIVFILHLPGDLL